MESLSRSNSRDKDRMSKRVERAIKMGSQLSNCTDSNGSMNEGQEIRRCVFPDKIHLSNISPGKMTFKNKPLT